MVLPFFIPFRKKGDENLKEPKWLKKKDKAQKLQPWSPTSPVLPLGYYGEESPPEEQVVLVCPKCYSESIKLLTKKKYECLKCGNVFEDEEAT